MNVVKTMLGKEKALCPKCGKPMKYIKTADFPYYKCPKCKWEQDVPGFSL